MRRLGMAIGMAVGVMALVSPAFPESAAENGHGHAIVTVLPKKHSEAPPNITLQDLRLKVNGRESTITNWVRLNKPEDRVELVVLIDSSARSSLGQQFNDIVHFIQGLPANVKVALGYMENGRAALTGPLSNDHAQVARGLHMPGGLPGSSGGPYFCLSDLAHNWPSADRIARREVVLITDGVDMYNLRYDPNDPYVQAAITDSVREGIVVYSIFWRNRGFLDNSDYETNTGQNLLAQLTQATGGYSFWTGSGNPVSFSPYFDNINEMLLNQYRLSFTAPLKDKPQVQYMNLKVGGPAANVYSPQRVLVEP